jgi:2-ketocyclohexanecarboxyl-CoA hydrolase
MSDLEVIYEVKNFVATITINRPKTLNAFTGDTIKDMERRWPRPATIRRSA